MYGRLYLTAVLTLAMCAAGSSAMPTAFLGGGEKIDLSGAVIVSRSQTRSIKAAEFLQTEIERRTNIRLGRTTSMPADSTGAIVLGSVEDFPVSYTLACGLEVPEKAEGYAIWVDTVSRNAPTVYLVGRDDRGALFAAGRLIRLLYLRRNYVKLPVDTEVADAPAYALRGQQIIGRGDGFIDWDNMDERMQSVRDMVLFGTNAFELTEFDSGIEETFAGILDDYGLDLWVYFGHGNVRDMDDADDVEDEFGHLRGLDVVFIPLGDSSGTPEATVMIPAIEHFAPLLKQVHPQAKIWMSYQCGRAHAEHENEYIFGYLQDEQPDWLEGMVYGPWSRGDIPWLRGVTPPQYRIRHYPDICHNRHCQYMIPKWDRAFARTWSRNGITVMPRMMAQIHNATAPQTDGFLAYNHTGVYNDLNKFIWSARSWDPDTDVNDILYDYGKVFFGYAYEPVCDQDGIGGDDCVVSLGDLAAMGRDWLGDGSEYDLYRDGLVDLRDYSVLASMWQKDYRTEETMIELGAAAAAKGILMLEDNWTGPVVQNESIDDTLTHWRKISECMGGVSDKWWRLELFLYKAHIDDCIKRKHTAEMLYQAQAYEALRQAETVGISKAISGARAALARVDSEFQSRWNFEQQLEAAGLSRYRDLDDILDNMYHALNDRQWLEHMFDDVRDQADIAEIVNWEDPGPGGFYDNLGVKGKQPHLVRQMPWRDDPGFVHSPVEYNHWDPDSWYRQSMLVCTMTRYDTPLLMRYEGLDPAARYKLKILYTGPFGPEMTLKAEGYEVHGPRENTGATPVTYPVPGAATSDGVLDLTWELVNIVRGPSVSELWLIKE